MRDTGRKDWLLNTFKGHLCPCGESELVCLEWYPNHKKITSLCVNNKNKTIGILHIHHILDAKIQ